MSVLRRLVLAALLLGLVLMVSASHSDKAAWRTRPPRPSRLNRAFGPETVANEAGYVTVRPHRHLWYWCFESRHDPSTDPLVLWLTGGPGASSLIALFIEQGPYIIDPTTLDLTLNPYSWNTRANIIFLDQPVGTGFSYVSTDANRTSDEEDDDALFDDGPLTERGIARDIYAFLRTFLVEHPKFAAAPLHIFAESYGGHYAPALASLVLEHNERARLAVTPEHRAKYIRINLQGIGIGNGLVNPLLQYESYAPFAREHDLVTDEQYRVMQASTPGCTNLIRQCRQDTTSGWHACLKAHMLCLYATILPVAATGVNLYDVRRSCGDQPLCYDMEPLKRFLAQKEVRRALAGWPKEDEKEQRQEGDDDESHAASLGKPWSAVNLDVNLQLALAGDWELSYAQDIPALLRAGVRVLVYAGQEDFIVNARGCEAWTNALEWPGREAYLAAPNTTWTVRGDVAGTARTAHGLTFVRVAHAGHMVPLDQPAHALDLLHRALDARPFDDRP